MILHHAKAAFTHNEIFANVANALVYSLHRPHCSETLQSLCYSNGSEWFHCV